MKRLLSLPPTVVESFHDITGHKKSDFFCTSDPAGRKVGSGGGTVWLLLEAFRHQTAENDFPTWLAREKRILLHAGGQSRRLPAYAPSGKVLTPIPVFRWERGQRIDQTLLDLQLPFYEDVLRHAPAALHTLVASGDVYIRTTEPLQTIPEADIVCYGLWSTPEQASHHGVFMMDRQRPAELDFMLQKPSTEEQAALMQTHFALMDIGVWLLSDRAVEALIRKCGGREEGTVPAFYDLYSQFGCALGNNPSSPDADLAGLSVAILPLEGGEFYHFGTTTEMISSSDAIQNLVKDQRVIIQRGVKRQSSVFTQNCLLRSEAASRLHNVWVENACVGDGWTLTACNVVTGVPQNDWHITLAEGQCLDIVPVGDDAFCLRPYGYDDAFRGDISDAATRFLQQPVSAWMEAHGVTPADLSNAADLQAAPLFPVTSSMEELERLAVWFLAAKSDDAAAFWRSLPRLSADAIMTHANLRRLLAQRRTFQKQTVQMLAANWQKSVFYQVNLKDMARKHVEEDIPLPAPLPQDAPLMTQIHDAMFRSEVLSASDAEEAKRQADKAFALLRDGITAEALRHKCSPRLTTCQDQIVWARSSARIDLAGGWTDTPPYSLLFGGNVVNAAIEMNGQPPLQVYVKPSRERVVICRSIDLGAMERITTFEQLADFTRIGSPFSIPKAALALAGFLPQFSAEPYASLQQQLEAYGCGIEITLLSAIPAGSGLGTSSILAATVLGAINDFCGLAWDKNEICNRTLVLEQLLTTGGGWQDQYGGVLHGVKLLQTQSGFDQTATTRWLPDTLFSAPELRPCHLLYYTGLTRTAKNILAEIVRGMFLNSTRHLALLADMKRHALNTFEAIQRGDFRAYGQQVRRSWEQNKGLDAGTNPPLIEALCQRIDDLCLGYKLPGAGGGGFMYMVAKDPQAALRIRETLTANPLAPNARFVDMSISTTGLQISRS